MFEDFTIYDASEPAGVELPKIFIEDDLLHSIDKSLTQASSNNDVLKSLVKKGIKEKGIDKLPNKKEYYDRAKYELDTFAELGFTDYILLNWDILDFCHRNNIPTGNGRGSAAGSLVLYLLKVTNVDPIINSLFFERFVSKNRAKKVYDKNNKEFLVGSLLPDVDSDISYDQRQRVIAYIEAKHIGRTAKILTLNTFTSKLCIREAAKYFNEANEEEANFVSDLIPKLHGKVFSLEKSVNESVPFASWAARYPIAYSNACKIENLNKNTGVHPSGIAICSQDIGSVSPLQKTKDGEVVTGYSMDDVSDLMVKFDILGLRTLTIAFNTCNKIGISLDDIDINDPFIYKVLQDFRHPIGLFQISADTNFRVAQDVKPDNLEELSDVVALARPGALQFVSDYITQKSTPTFLDLHPELDAILAWSKNVILYQEQLMQIAHNVFGLTLEEAETLRRIVGKKKVKEMGPWKEKIFEAGRKLKLEERISEFYWNALEASADYSFNKSHSVAYAILAAKTVYLKYKYPQEFFTSVLESAESEPDPLATVYGVNQELKDFGIKLLQPSLEKSSMGFTIEGQNIRYGLNSIKGISSKSLQALVEFRGKEFKNKYEVFSAAKEVGINISVLAALIQAGAMPDSGENRTRLVLEAQTFNLLTEREKRNFCKIGDRFGFDLLNSIAAVVEGKIVGDDNKLIMPDKRFVTLKKNFQKYKEIYQQNKKHEKFAKWWYENTLLGYSYSHNLKDAFNDEYGSLMDMQAVCDLSDKESFITVGQVSESTTRTSANGNKYLMVHAGDDFLSLKFLLMDNRRAQNLTAFQESGAKIKKGDILIFTGSKSGDTLFLDSIRVVDTKIYMKLNDIKNDKTTPEHSS